jgi:hypothetical protein
MRCDLPHHGFEQLGRRENRLASFDRRVREVAMQNDKDQNSVAQILDQLKAVKPEQVLAILRNAPGMTPDVRAGILEYLENEWDTTTEREEHEPRMKATMSAVAEAVGLQWDDRTPADHPFGAELDGALLRSGERVAVVELETKNRKQIDGVA